MKIITRNSDNIVVYAHETLGLDADCAKMVKMPPRETFDRRITTATATLYEVDALPEFFRGGYFTYTPESGFEPTSSGLAHIATEETKQRRIKAKAACSEAETILASADSDNYISNCSVEQLKGVIKILVNNSKETTDAKR